LNLNSPKSALIANRNLMFKLWRHLTQKHLNQSFTRKVTMLKEAN